MEQEKEVHTCLKCGRAIKGDTLYCNDCATEIEIAKVEKDMEC